MLVVAIKALEAVLYVQNFYAVPSSLLW